MDSKSQTCNVNLADKNGYTVLHQICSHAATHIDNEPSTIAKIVETIHKLMSSGAKINVKTNTGQTALHLAVVNECAISILRALIVSGIDVNIKDKKGHTAFYYACTPKTIQFRTKGNYNLSSNKDFQRMNLKFVDVRIAYFLSTQKARMDIKSKKGFTPLLAAILYRRSDLVKFMLENINYGNCNLEVLTPNKALYKSDKIDNVKVLPGSYAKLTALQVAVCNGDIKITDALVKTGANVNAIESLTKQPVLHMAANSLTNNRVNQTNEDYNTVKLDIGKLLIENGAKLDLKDKRGKTALIYAVSANTSLALYLIKVGADMNVQDKDGKTALHYATAGDKQEVVEALLGKGKDGIERKISDTALCA